MLVRDMMTSPVTTIDPKTTLQEARNIMEARRFRRLPVVDGDRLLGIITWSDIHAALGWPAVYPITPVEWVMSKNLITIHPEAPLVEALRSMREHHLSTMIVVEGTMVVGIITDFNVIEAAISLLETRP